MAENHPICVLKVNLQGCQISPEKVNEELQTINGVYGINIDTTEGLVIVTGLMDPPLLIETITKLGIETQLLAYEKNPTLDMKKIRDQSSSSLEDNYDSTDGGVHHHHNPTYDSHYMNPHGSSWHHPGYGSMQSFFRGPSYAHGMYPLYHNPQPNTSYVKSTRPPLPYPFDIYGDGKEPAIGIGYHHYFSEENVKACHIM